MDKITVKALIEERHISRQTFYYHFQDINDVIEWSVRRETEQLLRQSLELPQLRCGLELLIAHTAGQFDVLHKLLCSHRRQRFTDALTACVRVFLNGLLERFRPDFAVNQPDREVFLDYNSRALTGILLDYGGRRELDAARLSAQLERILLRQLAEPLEEMQHQNKTPKRRTPKGSSPVSAVFLPVKLLPLSLQKRRAVKQADSFAFL